MNLDPKWYTDGTKDASPRDDGDGSRTGLPFADNATEDITARVMRDFAFEISAAVAAGGGSTGSLTFDLVGGVPYWAPSTPTPTTTAPAAPWRPFSTPVGIPELQVRPDNTLWIAPPGTGGTPPTAGTTDAGGWHYAGTINKAARQGAWVFNGTDDPAVTAPALPAGSPTPQVGDIYIRYDNTNPADVKAVAIYRFS